MNLEYTDFEKLSGSRIINPDILQKARIDNVSIDSRKCGKNDVFFAIKGDKYNGHDFISEVTRKKTKIIVLEKNWFSKNKIKTNEISYVIVPDTIKALGELASIYRSKFLIPIIAVGGSNGKTTTKDFVAYVLSKKYNVLKTRANFNNAIGVPLTLFKLRNQHEIGVIEIGTNHFGEIENLCRIVKPQFGVLTNIGKEHLKYLRDINGVTEEEFELVEYLEKNYGTFFLNKDDNFLCRKILDYGLKKFCFGSKNEVEVKGRILSYDKFYPNVKIKYQDKDFVTTLSMIGEQGFDSALCAAAIGFFFEVPVKKIKNALKEHKLESKRRNELKNINKVWVMDDTYNSNPDSVKVALENIKKFKIKGDVHIVLGDMLELGRSSKDEHHEIGKLIKKHGFKNLYTIGKDSYYTFISAKGVLNNYYFTDKIVLSELLKLRIKKDDFILIKGSHSMKMDEVVDSLI